MKTQDILQFARKLIENARNAFRNNAQPGECIQVLGEVAEVAEVAYIWERNQDRLKLISTHLILEFTTKQNRSSDENAIYKQGIKDFGTFIMKCYQEDSTRK